MRTYKLLKTAALVVATTAIAISAIVVPSISEAGSNTVRCPLNHPDCKLAPGGKVVVPVSRSTGTKYQCFIRSGAKDDDVKFVISPAGGFSFAGVEQTDTDRKGYSKIIEGSFKTLRRTGQIVISNESNTLGWARCKKAS